MNLFTKQIFSLHTLHFTKKLFSLHSQLFTAVAIFQFFQFSVMKRLITRLIEAIKRGILRIFPLPITVGELSRTIVIVIVELTLIGCGTQRQVTQLVHDIQRDTIYISNLKHDSVYLNHERLIDRSKDTVYIKDVSVEYKYRLLRDTIKVVQKDSIPYEVTVTETKEITRPLTWFDHLTRLSFWFILGSFAFWIYSKVMSINHKL